MENWGLITYKDIYVLVDEKDTSVTTKQDVALTVAHELAHQWFGNLVTMVRLSFETASSQMIDFTYMFDRNRRIAIL